MRSLKNFTENNFCSLYYVKGMTLKEISGILNVKYKDITSFRKQWSLPTKQEFVNELRYHYTKTGSHVATALYSPIPFSRETIRKILHKHDIM